MLTAYDYPTARLLDEAGIPLLLVGDSVGRVILGYENEIPVSMADMLHHVKAVTRGTKRAFVIADMPFMSYATVEAALENAARLLAEGGAQAVKLEGGVRSSRTIEAITRAGHPGHGPHRADAPGDQRDRQGARPGQDEGRGAVPARRCPRGAGGGRLRDRARARARSSWRQRSPNGSGSRRSGSDPGPGCSGQVQVVTDLLGLEAWHPRHARPYADLRGSILDAARRYASDVGAGTFPSDAETVRMDDTVLADVLGRTLDGSRRAVRRGIPLDRDL